MGDVTSTPPVVDAFIHIGDIHFWHVVRNPMLLLNKRFFGNVNVWLRRRHEFLTHNADEFADWAAGTGIRDAVMTGDFTSTATHEEFRLAARFVTRLRDHGLAIAMVPGNHDVYTFEAKRDRRFERYFHEYLPEDALPARVTLRGGTPLILIPTVRPNILSSKGFISFREIERLALLLDACTGPTVVAGHYPVLARTYSYATARSRRLVNADALHKVLGSFRGPLLYACGHVHRFSYVRDARYPQLAHLSTGALLRDARESRRQGEFTEVQVMADRFEVFQHTFSDIWTRSDSVAPRDCE